MMPQPTIFGRVLALTAIVMCAVFALSASGEGQTKTAFAVVDMQKLSTKFTARETLETELRTMGQKFTLRLQRRDQMPFLSEEDQTTLDTLSEKATRTDADNNKVKEIEERNRKKSARLQELNQKQNLNEAEKKEQSDLQEDFRNAGSRFAKIKDELDGKVNDFRNSKSEELNTKVRTTVAKVAEKNSIAIVFTSDVALYAGTDITDQVVGELNKK
jgi:Skp family chaperone for outer membrane proteins